MYTPLLSRHPRLLAWKCNAVESVQVPGQSRKWTADMTSRQSLIVTPVLVLLGAMSLLCCGSGSGGGTSTGHATKRAPAPTVAALSPNSSQQGGSAFTLSVVGSNFVSGS